MGVAWGLVPFGVAGRIGRATKEVNQVSTIWVINQYALPSLAAGGTRHADQAAAWAKRGHNVRIWASPSAAAAMAVPPPTELARGSVAFEWVPLKEHSGNGLGRIMGMVQFAQALVRRGLTLARRERPDVIVGSTPHPFAALAGSLLARRLGVRFVLEVRDIWPLSVMEIMGVSRRHPFVRLLSGIEKYLYRNSDAIVGLMNNLDRHVRETIGADGPPVTWIPNGVDLTLYRDLSDVEPSRRPFKIVYAGAHGVPNNMETALAAMGAVDDPGVELHLYGDGVSKPALIAAAADLPNVVFHDPVPKAEIPRILTSADALIICWKDSPLYAHGVSANKLFDYLASGRPIVQSYSGANDIIQESGAGITVPAEDPMSLADAIKKLADAPDDELAEMGRRASTWVAENRSVEALADRFLPILLAT